MMESFSYACVIAVTVSLCTCNPLKLPVESSSFLEDSDLWLNVEHPNSEQSDNLIPVGLRRFSKIDQNYEQKELKDEVPLAISFRNRKDSLEASPASYEMENSRGSKRFYKHTSHPTMQTRERIIFPSEDDVEDNQSRGFPSSTPVTLSAHAESSTSANVMFMTNPGEDAKRNHIHSLRTLAHIVRHLLFRMQAQEATLRMTTIPSIAVDDRESVYQEVENSEKGDGTDSSSEMDVKEQSLYSGPKLRTTSSCPDGYKRTRNGSCQKPSRRLLGVSR